MVIPYYEITATYETLTHVFLPSFSGFTIRGALARLVRQASCKYRRSFCSTCPHALTCTYSRFFSLGKHPIKKTTYATPSPRPFTIVPPTKTKYAAEETLNITLRIFCDDRRWTSQFVTALSMLNTIGAGRKRGLGQVILKDIKTEKKPLNSKNNVPAGTYSLKTITPLIIITNKSFNPEPDIYHLYISAARRMWHMLNDYYYKNLPGFDPTPFRLLKNAQQHKLFETIHIVRWSDRRKRKELIKALNGTLTYQINETIEDEFLAMVHEFMQFYGTGKKSTCGFGHLVVDRIRQPH